MVSVECSCAAKSDGIVCVYDDGHGPAGSGEHGGNAIASFLLGQVDTFAIDLQTSIVRPRDHIEEFFVQDDWRATPKLTLNLGVRWTLHHPSTEKNNQGAVFNLATQQLRLSGVNGYPRSAREMHYRNFAPRVGLAYAVTPQTVMRAGFGIVFIDQSGITTPFTTPQFPFIQNVQQKTQDQVNAAFALSSGPTVAPIALTPDAGLGQSVYTAESQRGSGYVQQWNAGGAAGVDANPVGGGCVCGIAHCARGYSGLEPESADGGAACDGADESRIADGR